MSPRNVEKFPRELFSRIESSDLDGMAGIWRRRLKKEEEEW